MDDGESIEVVIEGEADDAAGSSSARRPSDADQRAAAAEGEAARTRLATARLVRENELNRVANDFLTAESEAKAAEAAIVEAGDLGDFKAQATANRKLAAAESKKLQAESQHEYLKRAPVSSGNAFEDHLSQFTDRTASWMRQHKDFVTDSRKNAKMVGAHHMAVSDGLEPDTSEYFSHVEKQLGIRSGGNGGSNNRGGNMQRNSNIDPSDVRTHVQDGGKSVYLTAGERKTATDGTLTWATGPNKGKPLGLQEFSRRKAAMIASGGWYDKI